MTFAKSPPGLAFRIIPQPRPPTGAPLFSQLENTALGATERYGGPSYEVTRGVPVEFSAFAGHVAFGGGWGALVSTK